MGSFTPFWVIIPVLSFLSYSSVLERSSSADFILWAESTLFIEIKRYWFAANSNYLNTDGNKGSWSHSSSVRYDLNWFGLMNIQLNFTINREVPQLTSQGRIYHITINLRLDYHSLIASHLSWYQFIHHKHVSWYRKSIQCQSVLQYEIHCFLYMSLAYCGYI